MIFVRLYAAIVSLNRAYIYGCFITKLPYCVCFTCLYVSSRLDRIKFINGMHCRLDQPTLVVCLPWTVSIL